MRRYVVLMIFCFTLPLLFGNALIDGERLVFDIRYGAITAGEATLNIERTEYRGYDAWRIWTTAETNSFFDRIFRVRDFIESMATADSLFSLRYTKRLHEGRYRQHRIHQNYLSQGFSTYSRFSFSRGEFTDTRLEIPANTYDVLSAFYKVRTMDLEPGQTIRLHVTSDGKNYTALINVLRRERIDTIFGRVDCLVIEPELEGEALFRQTGNIFVWLTDCERRIPVLLQSRVVFGHFRAILRSVREL